MARGLFKNWKQPIFYHYDTKLTRAVVEKAIIKLHEIGYQVLAIIKDMGPSGPSQWMWKDFGIDINTTFFSHPIDKEKKVYAFADVPHLIKLIRNHLLDDGFFLNEKILTTQLLLELLEHNSNSLRLAPRFTTKHLTRT